MDKFEDHSELIDEARAFDQQLKIKVETGEARNNTEAQDQMILEQHFAVDPIKDREAIKELVKRKRKQEGFNSKWGTYDGYLKYSKQQIENEEWSPEDWALAEKELTKERSADMFFQVASRYEQAGVVADSIVRQEQEQAIQADLEAGQPVLIRGNWRMGKTSMVFSLRLVGDEKVWEERNAESKRIAKEIEESGQNAFAYLSEWLKARGETAFIALDEVIAHYEDKEALEYFASLGKLSNLKVALVLHRFHQFEETFAQIFKDFKTHFIKPLTLEETTLLVRTPLAGTPIEITDEAIARIQEITGGRPMEINNICRQLFFPQDRYGRDAEKPKLRHDVPDVEAIMSLSNYELKDNVFSSAISTYKRVYAKSMSDEERTIIDLLIDQGSIPVGTMDSAKIKPLVDTTYVRLDEKDQVYRVNGTLFSRVVQELRGKS